MTSEFVLGHDFNKCEFSDYRKYPTARSAPKTSFARQSKGAQVWDIFDCL